MFKVDHVEHDVTLRGGVFSHEPVSTFGEYHSFSYDTSLMSSDPGSGVVPLIPDTFSHSPVPPCPVPDIWHDRSPTRNAPCSTPIESSVLFVDDVENECYATAFAMDLHIPYTEHPHMGYLRDLLFGLSENVPHLFVNSSSSMHNTLGSHGIGHEGLSMDECRLLYASHMLTGGCMLHDHAQSFPACAVLSQHYTTPQLMVINLVDILMSHTVKDLEGGLRTHEQLFGLFSSEAPTSSDTTESRLRCLLYWRQASISDSVAGLIQSLDSTTRPVLASLCTSHGLLYPKVHRKEDLIKLLSEHLVSGLCTHLPSDGGSLSGRELSSYLDVSYQTQLLKVLQNKGSLRVLRRILRILRLPFEDKSSVGQLRNEVKRYIKRLEMGKDVSL